MQMALPEIGKHNIKSSPISQQSLKVFIILAIVSLCWLSQVGGTGSRPHSLWKIELRRQSTGFPDPQHCATKFAALIVAAGSVRVAFVFTQVVLLVAIVGPRRKGDSQRQLLKATSLLVNHNTRSQTDKVQ